MLAKHHYCDTHDKVSPLRCHQTPEENYVARRFSVLKHSSNHTTNRVSVTTFARSVGWISMMKMICGGT
jgi:hypothetical protein